MSLINEFNSFMKNEVSADLTPEALVELLKNRFPNVSENALTTLLRVYQYDDMMANAQMIQDEMDKDRLKKQMRLFLLSALELKDELKLFGKMCAEILRELPEEQKM